MPELASLCFSAFMLGVAVVFALRHKQLAGSIVRHHQRLADSKSRWPAPFRSHWQPGDLWSHVMAWGLVLLALGISLANAILVLS